MKVKDITYKFMVNEGYIKDGEEIDFRDRSKKNLSTRIGKILKNRFGFKSGERASSNRDRTVIIDLNLLDRLRNRYIPKEERIVIDDIGLCIKEKYVIYEDGKEITAINLVDDKIECYCCNRYYDKDKILEHLGSKIDLDKAYIKGDTCEHFSNSICIKCFMDKVSKNDR
ncbi:MAG: hypothetical protein KatS3mg003_0643 [Candidatus Nitrosocaldaceae archaeon]|nr:MAG: hypothetical protein KatS3mg003_0643 [Candidatus Nitrosocaldaceae archaeon]